MLWTPPLAGSYESAVSLIWFGYEPLSQWQWLGSLCPIHTFLLLIPSPSVHPGSQNLPKILQALVLTALRTEGLRGDCVYLKIMVRRGAWQSKTNVSARVELEVIFLPLTEN